MKNRSRASSYAARVHPMASQSRIVRRVLFVAVATLSAGIALAQGSAEEERSSTNPTGTYATGAIAGQLYTARHPDSVAVNADLVLFFRDGGVLERRQGRSGSRGEYRFENVSVDPAIQYVVQVDHRGREYLGAPMAFAAGQSLLEFNFLVSEDAPPVESPTRGSAPADPRFGEPLDDAPWTTLAIVSLFVVLFALPIYRFHRQDRKARVESQVGHDRLIRDIANLDLRFEAGEVAEPEYRSLREQLLGRLQAELGPLR